MELKDWGLSELGEQIWRRKYQFEDETFEQWLDRVSGGDEELRQLILEKKFLFGGRILAGRNVPKNMCYSNCFVLPAPEDNIEAIFETAKESARTYSYGGGVGFAISKLRPKGMVVHNSAKETSGAVSFMDLFSTTTELICQNGRRGALMISLDIGHPDVEDFINIKTDLEKVTKANISIMSNDEFLKAVLEDEDWVMSFTTETGDTLTKSAKARDLFHLIAKNNWRMGEPGFLYMDRIHNWNLTCGYDEYKIVGTNPCGEQPLSDYSSCLLGSINLSEFVLNPFTDEAEIDIESLGKAIHVVVRAMDDVLEENIERLPLEKQKEKSRDWRQIGIGHMGLADTFIKLGITYGSEESRTFSHKLGRFFINECVKASSLLAKERGTFPKYDHESLIKSDFYVKNIDPSIKQLVKMFGMRNCALTSIAPTGSIGTMLGVSTGIEPNFRFTYTRKTESLGDGDTYFEVDAQIVEDYLKVHPQDKGNLPSYFVESSSISPSDRIELQGTWQEYIDTAISSTINLPEHASVEDIEEIYINAWRKGLKGVTVFRDNCERMGILTTGKEETIDVSELQRGEWKSLAEDTYYIKRNLTIGCGKLKLFVGISPSEGNIQDVYITKCGSGGCEKNLQCIAILMSAVLRIGGNLSQIEKSFSGVSACPSFTRERGKGNHLSDGSYCGLAILKEMKKVLAELEKPSIAIPVKEKKIIETPKEQPKGMSCPECGEPLIKTNGCDSCSNCGYSKCG
jgi:ribonucleoside-diphosphate reductase alpha chain